MVNMHKWKQHTRSHYYGEWSADALALLDYVGDRPIVDRAMYPNYSNIFMWSVRDKSKEKYARQYLLKIALTDNGRFEYIKDGAHKQEWFVEEAVSKTALLCEAFSKFGFMKGETNE